MERLTESQDCYYGEQQKIRQLCYMGFDCDCKYPSCSGCTILKLYRKLAAYEDTGLEPEEIKETVELLKDVANKYETSVKMHSITTKLLNEHKERMNITKIESYQGQYEAAESMLNNIYQGEIIGATAYNVINQALQSMGEMIAEKEEG
ncbi:hypothetical protein [Sedimentibacter sp.]|uniref:hypothetical protein n=1 Tax=Sedimentibacter sp. TaxID=1960295 RepID=UPI0028B03860|nr:hypothetical protein [Sedimentibacter sp.]